MARRLAHAKAQQIAAQQTEAWVIGSDQVAALADPDSRAQILGKPGTRANCIKQLQDCSGRTVEFLTAVAVRRHVDGAQFEFVDTTRVQFRMLNRETIERYVELESPLDCAGAFKSEGLGISLLESIVCTDPSALVGLPLIRLAAVLRSAGFQLP